MLIFMTLGTSAVCAQLNEPPLVQFDFSVLYSAKPFHEQQLYYRTEGSFQPITPSFTRISPIPYKYEGDDVFVLYEKLPPAEDGTPNYRAVGSVRVDPEARRLLFYLRKSPGDVNQYQIGVLNDSKQGASNIRFWNQTNTVVYGQIGDERWKLEEGKIRDMPISSKNAFEGVLLRLTDSSDNGSAEVTHFKVGSPDDRGRTLVIILPPHPYNKRGGLGIRIYQY